MPVKMEKEIRFATTTNIMTITIPGSLGEALLDKKQVRRAINRPTQLRRAIILSNLATKDTKITKEEKRLGVSTSFRFLTCTAPTQCGASVVSLVPFAVNKEYGGAQCTEPYLWRIESTHTNQQVTCRLGRPPARPRRVIFLDLRDRYGIVQVTINPNLSRKHSTLQQMSA